MKRINRLYSNLYRILTRTVYGRKFRYIGKKACVFDPLQIDNPEGIAIHENVLIAHHGWLMGSKDLKKDGLVIKQGTKIGHFCHIIALHSVTIEDNVLIADRVFISDSTHSYEDIGVPVIDQPVLEMNKVVIGEGSWIGEGACILGASIGKHCIVGANSVVTRDFPDYSVIAGVPAKLIKHYDEERHVWI